MKQKNTQRTRIIKQKLTKKLTQKEKKKYRKAKIRRLGGRRRVTGWVEGEVSPMVRRTEASPESSQIVRRTPLQAERRDGPARSKSATVRNEPFRVEAS